MCIFLLGMSPVAWRRRAVNRCDFYFVFDWIVPENIHNSPQKGTKNVNLLYTTAFECHIYITLKFYF